MVENTGNRGFLEDEVNEDGLYPIYGLAIGDNDITVGSTSGEPKLWRPEVLEESAETLEGKDIVVNHENQDAYKKIGEIDEAKYEEGRGVLYRGAIDDDELAEKIARDWLEVSPRIKHSKEHEEIQGVKVPESIRDFDNLSVVRRGAAGSNELTLGETDELSVEELQASFEDDGDSVSEYQSIVDDDTIEELQEDVDYARWMYDDREGAEGAAERFGCEGTHTHEVDGETWYMPCETHDKFLQGLKEEREEELQETFNDYPQAASENAQQALDAREDTDNPNDCGTEVGWRRANQLANNETLSRDTVARMAAFRRHQENADQGEEGRENCGWMMWKAWGGEEGVSWAERKMEQTEETALAELSESSYSRGDFVQWDSSGGTARGRVIQTTDSETYNDEIDGNVSVSGDEDDPAALITVYQETSDGWESTDTTVAHKFSTLRSWDAGNLVEENSLVQEMNEHNTDEYSREELRTASQMSSYSELTKSECLSLVDAFNPSRNTDYASLAQCLYKSMGDDEMEMLYSELDKRYKNKEYSESTERNSPLNKIFR